MEIGRLTDGHNFHTRRFFAVGHWLFHHNDFVTGANVVQMLGRFHGRGHLGTILVRRGRRGGYNDGIYPTVE